MRPRSELRNVVIGACSDLSPCRKQVMRPAAKRIFEGDVGTLESFCRLAQPHIVPTFEEVRKQFGTEFNYTEEAINMELVGDAVNPDWEGRVRVPRPIMDLCRENILVMEYIPGVKLVEAVKRQAREEARRRGITLEDLKDQHMAWMRRPPSCLTWLSSLRRAATMKVARVVLSCAWAPRKVAHWAGCCGERPPPPLQVIVRLPPPLSHSLKHKISDPWGARKDLGAGLLGNVLKGLVEPCATPRASTRVALKHPCPHEWPSPQTSLGHRSRLPLTRFHSDARGPILDAQAAPGCTRRPAV